MSEPDDFNDFIRSRRRRRGRSEPEPEPEVAKPAPLITQGARSSAPQPSPPSPDELIRNAALWKRGTGLWVPIE
jgi:hypothetical protein